MNPSLRRVLISGGVWLLILVGFYFAIWRPRIGVIDKLQAEIKQQHTVMTQLERDIRDFPETITIRHIQVVEENLEQVFARIPSKEEVDAILRQIQEYGTQRADLHIKEITDLTDEFTPGVPQVSTIPKSTYQIRLEGDTKNIIEFLHEIENGIRLITIESFTLRRLNVDEDALEEQDLKTIDSVDAEVTLNVFYSNFGTSELARLDQ